jgi:hypothetical protein
LLRLEHLANDAIGGRRSVIDLCLSATIVGMPMSHAAFSTMRSSLALIQLRTFFPQSIDQRINVSWLQFSSSMQLTLSSCSFVQGLQDKIRDLEAQLARNDAQGLGGPSHQARHPGAQLPWIDPNTQEFDMDLGNGGSSVGVNVRDLSPTHPFQSPRPQGVNSAAATPSNTQSPLLVDELRLLALEATAERHLGNSSGISFAKLTQAVLLRLSPDKAEFVFDNSPAYGLDSSNHPVESLLQNFSDSLSCCPALFTGITLADITEPADVLAELRLPDDPHLSSLVDFYFAHSHTLYPILNRGEFLSILERTRLSSSDASTQSPLDLFRIWMVLAIGATSFCSITLVEESEPMSYYNKAMLFFEDALNYGEMVNDPELCFTTILATGSDQ